ncbi:MAG: hypothetical protein AAF492_02805 [Verrucomicrobiota bacterium]
MKKTISTLIPMLLFACSCSQPSNQPVDQPDRPSTSHSVENPKTGEENNSQEDIEAFEKDMKEQEL